MINEKILLVATTDNMIWQFMLPHIKQMQDMGNKIECACNRSGFWFDDLKQKGVTVHEMNFARNPIHPKNLKGYKQLKKLFKDGGFTLVHCCQPVGGVMGRMVAKKFKKPCIYVAHGFHFFKGAPFVNRLVYKNVEKHFAKCTDILVTMNEEDFAAAKTFKAKKVYKINGIGVNLAKYKDQKPFDKDQFRAELGLNESDKVILTVAEHIKRKNYPTALKTIANLPEEYKFVICGCGKLEEEHKKLAKELGIENRTKFLGYRKDINKIMQVSDLFLFTSFQEGLPLSVEEAMTFGLPVVCSKIRGNVDLIDDPKGGFVIDDKLDPVAFAEAIKKIFEQNLQKSMGDYNKEKIKNYDITNVLNQMKQIYEEI